MLSVGSLFSGIGGFELGLELTGGFMTAWQCEIDPFCLKVLEKHWPDVKRFMDIKKMGIEEKIPYVDVICGGFPCQPVSCAGKRKGSQDERWLWPEFYRVVCEVKPRWVLVENVPGLLSADSGRLFAGILRDLASSGYDAEWQVISANFVGSQQLRERLYLVAYSAVSGTICKSARDERPQGDISVRGRVFGGNRKMAGGQGSKAQRYTEPWATEPNIRRVADGIPNQLDRLRALGNAIVPQCAEYVGRCILEAEARQ